MVQGVPRRRGLRSVRLYLAVEAGHGLQVLRLAPGQLRLEGSALAEGGRYGQR